MMSPSIGSEHVAKINLATRSIECCEEMAALVGAAVQ